MNKFSGVVVIMDLLGGKMEDRQEIIKFIEARNKLKEIFEDKAQKAGEMYEISLRVQSFTFGDTILFALHSASDDASESSIMISALIGTRRALAFAVSRGMPFRGSLSYGDYYIDEHSNTVLGPAVNDAVSWYDKTEILGVVATPSATLLISSNDDLYEGKKSINHRFCIIDVVPNKFNYESGLAYINWPMWIYFENDEMAKDEIKLKILSYLSKMKQPPGTENKYNNTVKIVEKCLLAKLIKPKSSSR